VNFANTLIIMTRTGHPDVNQAGHLARLQPAVVDESDEVERAQEHQGKDRRELKRMFRPEFLTVSMPWSFQS